MGLHCEPLPASTSFGYIRQGQSNRMSIPTGNGATGASGTGPALGYTLNLLWFNILFMLISENNLNTNTHFVHTLSLFYVMNLLVIFRIKIYRKLSISLTDREKKKKREQSLIPRARFNHFHWQVRYRRLARSVGSKSRALNRVTETRASVFVELKKRPPVSE